MNMTITVKFIGALRHLSGAGKLDLEYEGCGSIGELVNKLFDKLPVLKRSLINQQLADPRPNALILVNDREIGVLDGLGTKLRDGDEVVFVPVVHGG